MEDRIVTNHRAFLARTVLAVAENLPEFSDMDPQADLLDGEARPRVGKDFVLRNDLAGAAHQQAQDIHCATAQLDRRAVPFEQARPEGKRPERDGIEIEIRAARAISCRELGHLGLTGLIRGTRP